MARMKNLGRGFSVASSLLARFFSLPTPSQKCARDDERVYRNREEKWEELGKKKQN
jgi:hypothetical protein